MPSFAIRSVAQKVFSAEEIKDKVLGNKNKYSNSEIAELAEDILLRLEIEIAKLEMLKEGDNKYLEGENIEQKNIEKQNINAQLV